jgi:hypothetical protein
MKSGWSSLLSFYNTIIRTNHTFFTTIQQLIYVPLCLNNVSIERKNRRREALLKGRGREGGAVLITIFIQFNRFNSIDLI